MSIAAGPAALLRGVAGRGLAMARSTTGSQTLWYAATLAVVQTILLSRVLGIQDYGIYGLIFATLGFASSIVGFQTGLTGTVFVARYLTTSSNKYWDSADRLRHRARHATQ